MHQFLAPLEAEAVEQDGEHLEVVVLFVAHHVDHLVDGEVVEAHGGSADVLRHVDAGAVGAEQQFLVETFLGEVSPHAVVVLAEEESFLQSFLHLLLAHEISVGLVVYLVECHAERLVGFVESGIHPVVHLLPKRTYFRVALLPFHEHGMCLLDEGGFSLGLFLGVLFGHAFGQVLCLERLALFLVVLVERHVEVANEVVAFLAGRFRCGAVAPFLPCQHRLADVYAAVVHDVGLHHAVAVGGHDLRQRPTQQVVAHVSQVERLVGVG